VWIGFSLLNVVFNMWVTLKAENFSTKLTTVSFSLTRRRLVSRRLMMILLPLLLLLLLLMPV
jgi:hypothetical protein